MPEVVTEVGFSAQFKERFMRDCPFERILLWKLTR